MNKGNTNNSNDCRLKLACNESKNEKNQSQNNYKKGVLSKVLTPSNKQIRLNMKCRVNQDPQQQFIFLSQTTQKVSINNTDHPASQKKIELTSSDLSQNSQLSSSISLSFTRKTNNGINFSDQLKSLELELLEIYNNEQKNVGSESIKIIQQKLIDRWAVNSPFLNINVLEMIQKNEKNRSINLKNKNKKSFNQEKQTKKLLEQKKCTLSKQKSKYNQAKQQIQRLSNYKTNIYRLLPNSFCIIESETLDFFSGSIVREEFLSQLINKNNRLSRAFSETVGNDTDMLKVQKNYVRSKQVIASFCNIQARNIDQQNQQSQEEKIFGCSVHQIVQKLTKIKTEQFSKNIIKENQLINYPSQSTKNFKLQFDPVLSNKEMRTILQQKYLCLATSLQIRTRNLKYKNQKKPFADIYQNIYASLQLQLTQNQEKTNISMFLPDQTQLKQVLLNKCLSFNNSVEYQNNQKSLYNLEQINEKFKNYRQSSLAAKINGKLIYKMEENVEKLKQSDQLQASIINAINERGRARISKNFNLKNNQRVPQNKYQINDKNKQRNVGYDVKQHQLGRRASEDNSIILNDLQKKVTNEKIMKAKQRDQSPRQRIKVNPRQIQIIKKLKNTQQSTIIPSNRSHSYSNINQNSRNSYLNGNSNNCQQGPIFENYLQARKGRKNKVDLKQEKKRQFDRYLQSMCHKTPYDNYRTFNPKKYSYNQQNQNYGYSLNSPNMINPKIIKFNKSKYPISFNQETQFKSENPQDCSIIYRAQDLNIKQLALRFIRDRRRFGVNKVIIKCSSMPYEDHQNNHQFRKAMRAMQILCCMGADVRLMQQNGYKMLEKKQSPTVQLVAFFLRQNIQKVWEAAQDFNDGKK